MLRIYIVTYLRQSAYMLRVLNNCILCK